MYQILSVTHIFDILYPNTARILLNLVFFSLPHVRTGTFSKATLTQNSDVLRTLLELRANSNVTPGLCWLWPVGLWGNHRFFKRTSRNGYPEPLNDEKHETMKSMNQLKRLDDTFWFIFVFVKWCDCYWVSEIWHCACQKWGRFPGLWCDFLTWLLVTDTVQFEDDLFLKWVHKRWV